MNRPKPSRPLPSAADFEFFRPSSERRGGAGRRHPQDRRRPFAARLLLWTSLCLTGLAAAGAAAMLVWSPAALVRAELIERVKARTGRALVIAGPASLTFYPGLAITLSDVSLSPPAGMAGAPTISTRSLEVSVALLPLLRGEVSIDRLALSKPVIDLRIDARGRRSWDMASLEPPTPVRLAEAPTGAGRYATGQMPKELQDFVRQSSPGAREAQASRGLSGALEHLSLADVRIDGGTVRYTDERSGINEEVQSVDARLTLPSAAGPLDAGGSFVWRGEPVRFETRVALLGPLLEGRSARLGFKLAGRPADLAWEGTVSLGHSPEAEGALTARVPSLKTLAALLGGGELDAPGFGTANITGRLKVTDAALSLADATARLDDVIAQGTIALEKGERRPMLRGVVHVSELDLNKYALPNVAPSIAPATTPAPQSIQDLLRGTEPHPVAKVRGFARRAGWSDEPINLAAFGIVDADLGLGVGRLLFRDIKAGPTRIRLALQDRVLNARFEDVQLYDGKGRGLLTLDGTGAQAVLGANFQVEGASALPLLKDAASFDWLAGRGRVSLAVTGQGATERQIVSTLQGKADVALKDGAVIGYDVARMLRGIMQGKITGLERSPAEKTDFSEMAAGITIINGVAHNKDLRLISPLVRISGAGSANLAERTLDYTLRPRLAAAPAGPSAATAGGLEVPVRLTGSWDKPAITPDFEGVLKNPDQTVDAIKELGRQLKNGDGAAAGKAKELLNQLLKR